MSYDNSCLYVECIILPPAASGTPICNAELLLKDSSNGSLKCLTFDGTDKLGKILTSNPTTGCIEWDDPCNFLEVTFTRLDCLSDVTITTPAESELIQFDGTEWVNVGIGNISPYYDESPPNARIVPTVTSSVGTGSNTISGGNNNAIIAGKNYMDHPILYILLLDLMLIFFLIYLYHRMSNTLNYHYYYPLTTIPHYKLVFPMLLVVILYIQHINTNYHMTLFTIYYIYYSFLFYIFLYNNRIYIFFCSLILLIFFFRYNIIFHLFFYI
jgi:hypothetical protein